MSIVSPYLIVNQMKPDINPQAFLIEYNLKDFYITASPSYIKNPTTLHIDRETGKIRQYPAGSSPLKVPDKSIKKLPFCLMVGIMVVNNLPFLALATEAEKVAWIVKHDIYVIRNVRFINFKANFDETSLGYSDTIKTLDSIRDLVLNDNFYFSYTYNLTLSQQKQQQGHRQMEVAYFWNQNLLERFFGLGLESYWHTPIVQGYISMFAEENDYIEYYYIMISRRSREMSGTRFYSRGIDTHGNAANFVETEEIMVCHNYVLSYVQLRGSLPIFWVQSGFGAAPYCPAINKNALVTPKHYRILEEQYEGRIVTINLLGMKSGQPERELSKKFEEVIAALPEKSRQEYITYDFNHEVEGKNDVQVIIKKFIEKHVEELAPPLNFFAADFYRDKLELLQKSFNRSNCLDCLDRTNVIMYKISEKVMQYFHNFINSKFKQDEKKVKLSKKFEQAHREAWLEGGDRISMIYSGTASISSYITKGEKNKNFFSIVGSSFKSINRFYNANVNDEYKQKCLNFVLGEGDSSRTFYFEDNINKRLPQIEFNSFEEIGLCILTWNCSNVNPVNLNLEKLFNFEGQDINVVIICLQQMVELNPYNILLGANKSTQQLWRERLEQHFREKMPKPYVYLVENDLVGIFTMVFVLESNRTRITSLNWSEIKTGFKGSLGNKGSVLLSFCFDDTILTFMNCHLEAGEGKTSERLYSLEQIHNTAFPERFKRRQFENSEFKFLIGDLNFRIEMPFQQIKELMYEVEKKRNSEPEFSLKQLIKKLNQRDQLNNNRKRSTFLSQYEQKQITFLPTYKYVNGTNQYDWKSKRAPSWCDRILYNAENLKILPRFYGIKQINESDHKPVIAYFDLLVRKEDRAKKRALFEKYMSS